MAESSRTRNLPWKTIFLVGFILGAGIVMAVTFAPGDAGQVSDGVPYGAPDGMNATLAGDTNLIQEPDTLFPSSDTVQFKTEDGNITFQSNGPAWATVRANNITGTYTNVTEIDATQNDITINPEDKRRVTVGGDIERIEFRDAAVDDGSVDFVYAGSSGSSTVTVRGLPANTEIAAVDQTHGGALDGATTDGSGTATFDLPNSEHAVTLQTSDGGPSLSNLRDDGSTRDDEQQLSVDLSDPDFPDDNVTLEWYVDGNLETTTYATSGGTHSITVGPLSDGSYDYSVVATDVYGASDSTGTNSFTIDHYDPEISNIQPSGDLDVEPADISADISDQDFGGSDGDTLTVDISLDGSQIDSQTINSDSTVSTSMPSSGQTAGSHTITYEVTDDYGQTVTDSTTYRVPDTLSIRNETNQSQLVPADGEVRFFGEDQVYSRSAPDGTVNMTGLPVNQDFIVEVDPTSDDYTERTIFIQSIYEQQSAYVLNTSAYNSIESRFVLDDPTGQYDSETVLQIRKIINVSGTTSYQTVVADEFGTEGVTATLEEGQRYELSVVGDGDTQSVGPYRADTSETVSVQPDSPSINLTQGQDGYAYGANLTNQTLEYVYNDPQQDTTQLIVWIHERGNESNLLQPNESAFDIGSYSGIVNLDANETNKEWVVNFVITRNGETFVVNNIVGARENLTPPVGGNWLQIIGISVLILFAGAFSVLNSRIGALVIALVGGILWFVGFLGTAATGASVAVAIFIAVIGYMRGG